MRVTDIKVQSACDHIKLSATVFSPGLPTTPFDLVFNFHGVLLDQVSTSGDSLLAALLLPAMVLGEDLEIDAAVSPRLKATVATICEIYQAWFPAFNKQGPLAATIHNTLVSSEDGLPNAGYGNTGLFFSGGVDSFYTLLKGDVNKGWGKIAEISHLILIRGFDISLGAQTDRLFDAAQSNANRVALETGRQLITVYTNLRSLSESIASWPLYHGAALASVGLALSPLLDTCVIASSLPYQWLEPWGSHPLLDPLWSTEELLFVHDGCEATRSEKILSRIASSALARQTLRVCWENPGGKYNCGRCEKCIRTMIPLKLAGVLEHCPVFNTALDLDRIRTVANPDYVEWTTEIPELLASHADRALQSRVSGLLRANRRRRLAKNLVRHYVRNPAVEQLRKAWAVLSQRP